VPPPLLSISDPKRPVRPALGTAGLTQAFSGMAWPDCRKAAFQNQSPAWPGHLAAKPGHLGALPGHLGALPGHLAALPEHLFNALFFLHTTLPSPVTTAWSKRCL
jgi:hypothetical protein